MNKAFLKPGRLALAVLVEDRDESVKLSPGGNGEILLSSANIESAWTR